MNHEKAGHYWNGNADAWTKLARTGFDVYRDHFRVAFGPRSVLRRPEFIPILRCVRSARDM